jgi:hypothetical protein
MKKVILTTAAMLFVAITFAQTKSPATIIAQDSQTKATPSVDSQMKELDNCIRNYNSEKTLAKRALIKGEFKTSKTDYAIADADKKYIKAMAAQLKIEGVHHPLRLAHKEISKADNKMIVADIKTIKADKLAKQKALKIGDSTAVKAAETNLIADKSTFKKDINEASHDQTKHFTFVRIKS